jgi:predicted MPP superfamily phosphohydrolase
MIIREDFQSLRPGDSKVPLAGRFASSEFKILLCHSPDVRESIKNETKIDLTLCGHTHGGQVAIPYLSHHFIPIKNPSRYISGLVEESYGYTYVNRGIGTLVFPFRIPAPPEISYFTLRKNVSDKSSLA